MDLVGFTLIALSSGSSLFCCCTVRVGGGGEAFGEHPWMFGLMGLFIVIFSFKMGTTGKGIF